MKKCLFAFVLFAFLCGFKMPNKEKHLISIDINYFSFDVIDNIKSEKSIKITFVPRSDFLVPVINNKQLFYTTKIAKSNFWKNNSNVIIHMDWDYDSTVPVEKTRFKILKSNKEYVETIDLSAYSNIKSITFSIVFFDNLHPFAGLFNKKKSILYQLYHYSYTVYKY